MPLTWCSNETCEPALVPACFPMIQASQRALPRPIENFYIVDNYLSGFIPIHRGPVAHARRVLDPGRVKSLVISLVACVWPAAAAHYLRRSSTHFENGPYPTGRKTKYTVRVAGTALPLRARAGEKRHWRAAFVARSDR